VSQMVELGDVADVNWGDTSTTKSAYVDEGFCAYSAAGPDGFLPYSDYDREAVVLSAIGARCGKTWFATGKWSCIKNTIRLWSTTPKLDNKYLYWVTNREDFFPKRGAAQPFITIGDARKACIYLPPLDEQKRIAAILDKADQLRQKRRQAIALLDNLTQSIFLEMFGDPVSNSKGWELRELAAFEKFLTSGSRGWAAYYADAGRPFIRIQNLKKGQLSTDDLVFVNAPENAEARRTTVAAGDVLISITADLGRIAVVPPGLDGGANINQHIALFRPQGINSTYLASYLASRGGKRQFSALNRQGVKAGLNFSDIRRLQIIVPPIELQKKFEQLLISQGEQHVRQIIGLRESDTLFSSLQHRAFSGQL